MDVTARLEVILRKVLKLGKDAAVADDWEPGNPPEWDSLANMALISYTEDEFGIELEFEDLLATSNWGEYKALVAGKAQG